MFGAFKVLRQLHEMLWLLAQAEARAYGPDTAEDVRHPQASVREVAEGPLEGILAADVESLHLQVAGILRGVGEEIRAGPSGLGGPTTGHPRARQHRPIHGSALTVAIVSADSWRKATPSESHQ